MTYPYPQLGTWEKSFPYPHFTPEPLSLSPDATSSAQVKAWSPEVKASNPKEAVGSTKLDMTLVPSSAVAYLASAFTEGALKYGSYNWRVSGVRASTYVAAASRHIFKWWNGEDADPKTRVKHLANALACLSIILDAEMVNMLNDDRPPKADMDSLIEELGQTVAHLKEMSRGLTPHHNTALDAKAGNV